MHRFEDARKFREVLFELAGFYWYLMIKSHMIMCSALCPEVGCGHLEGGEFGEKYYRIISTLKNLQSSLLVRALGKEDNTSN